LPVATENIQPVRFLETDDRLAHPTPGIALCLSGGGYRAMLFHLGALWRLNDAGLLRGLIRVSSVSGGSITAGVLGLHWKRLQFNESNVATNLEELVIRPIRQLADDTIDEGSIHRRCQLVVSDVRANAPSSKNGNRGIKNGLSKSPVKGTWEIHPVIALEMVN
jgi:Patatin-like phospholipase